MQHLVDFVQWTPWIGRLYRQLQTTLPQDYYNDSTPAQPVPRAICNNCQLCSRGFILVHRTNQTGASTLLATCSLQFQNK